jgi:hypothetical protein
MHFNWTTSDHAPLDDDGPTVRDEEPTLRESAAPVVKTRRRRPSSMQPPARPIGVGTGSGSSGGTLHGYPFKLAGRPPTPSRRLRAPTQTRCAVVALSGAMIIAVAVALVVAIVAFAYGA